jgi:hypothetical protein
MNEKENLVFDNNKQDSGLTLPQDFGWALRMMREGKSVYRKNGMVKTCVYS